MPPPIIPQAVEQARQRDQLAGLDSGMTPDPAHELAVLRNAVRDLEERLSQAEAAVEWGPPNRPSQAALDIAAKREIARLRNAIRTHRDAVKSSQSWAGRLHDGTADTGPDPELWRHIGEAE